MTLLPEPKVIESPTWQATIWIAGDLADIRRACRAYTMSGLCVTVTPTSFIFTGGSEAGAAVGLINYPRFPKDEKELEARATHLAVTLVKELCQQSCCVVMPSKTLWLTRRDEDAS